MPKLPENFDYYVEKPTHPYRPLLITVAVIVGGSLFAGGLFYASLRQVGNLSDTGNQADNINQPLPKKLVITDDMRQKLLVDVPAADVKEEDKIILSSSQLVTLLSAKSKDSKGRIMVNSRQLELLLQ